MQRHAKFAACSALVGTALVLAAVVPPAAASGPATAAVATSPAATTDSDTPTLVDGIAEQADAKGPADRAALAHLKEKKDRYNIPSAETNLVATDVAVVGGDETVRFTQQHRGVEVLGGQYIVRMKKSDAERIVTGTSGRYFTDLAVDTTPSISKELAVQRAVQAVQHSGSDAGSVGGESAGSLTGADQGLVVLPQGAGVLTRHVTVRGTNATGAPVVQEVYVEATTGYPALQYSGLRTFAGSQDTAATASDSPASAAVAAAAAAAGTSVKGAGTLLNGKTVSVDLTFDAAAGTHVLRDTTRSSTAAIETYNALDLFPGSYEPGTIPEGVTLFTSPTTELGADLTSAGAVDAHWGAEQVYDYYKTRLGRDSIDGQGGVMRSLVGLSQYGSYNNAYWDGTQMAYGVGDYFTYKPFTADLDVQGHELTHGVVQHTANLVYIGQSGALNEAIADYFGNAVDVEASGTPMTDPHAGLLGEDLCYNVLATACALRDLNDGRTVSTFGGYPIMFDSGGVHLNSTIVGGALWDIREALGGAVADPIVYKALVGYLTPLDGFTAARNAVVAAAKASGLKAAQLKIVQKAFDAHGIVDGWEKSLGGDATLLLDNLNQYGDSWAGAGGGWWTVSKAQSDSNIPFTIYAGRTSGKGAPIAVSQSGEYNVYPDTDGKTVVWVQFLTTGGVNVMARSLSGGPERILATAPINVLNVRVSGDTVTWDDFDPESFNRRVNYASLASGEVVSVGGGQSGVPDVRGGKIAYVRAHPTEITNPTGVFTVNFWAVEVLDIATGAVTELGPRTQGVLTRPTIIGDAVYWIANDKNDGFNALRKAPLSGGSWTDVIAESEAGGLHEATDLTASDTALTITKEAYSEHLRAGVMDMYQYALDGKPLGKVTCTTGVTQRGAADMGTTVVWIDSTTSYDNLVMRTKPAGTCS